MLVRLVPTLLLPLSFLATPRAQAQNPWIQVEEITPAVQSCCTEAVAIDSGVCVAAGQNELDVYERDALGVWVPVAQLAPGGLPGFTDQSVAVDGDRIAAGFASTNTSGTERGQVLVLERDPGGVWGEVTRLVASDGFVGDGFGSEVALSGDVIAVGRNDFANDRVYVFERDPGGSTWIEVAMLASPMGGDPGFGHTLDLEHHTLAVGFPWADTLGLKDTGAAFVYERDASAPVWTVATTLIAHDAQAQALFGMQVDLDGERLAVSDWGGHFARIHGLALDPETGGLYASDQLSDTLYRITPTAAHVGQMGQPNVFGLASDVLTNTVYATGPSTQPRLSAVDGTTGLVTVLPMDTGFDNVRALAFDPNTGTLYGADNDGGPSLIVLDTTTGAGTLVGPTGQPGINGLAFDAASSTLYGITGFANMLVTLDVATGAGTAIAPVSVPGVTGLEFDPATGLLLGSTPDNELLSIDPLTGQATTPVPIDATPYFNPGASHGSVYVHERDEDGTGTWTLSEKVIPVTGSIGLFLAFQGDSFFSSSWDRPLSVFELEAGGSWQEQAVFPQERSGPISGGGGLFAAADKDLASGVDFVRVYSRASTSYCTAGTSTSGCRASLSAEGLASATQPGGFLLSASQVEGQKNGHFYFGINGRQANPWGNGSSYQCIVPPVRRAPSLPVVGTSGQCDGSFALDLNAVWCPTCPKPHYNPGPGVFVQAQLWYRDPQNTSNQTTSLSDALESLVTP